MKVFYIYLCVVLSVLSCRKIVPIDEEYHQPKIVLNGAFSEDNAQLSVYVTESQPVYGFNKHYKMVDDAQLSLYKNDEKIGEFSLSSDSLVRSEYEPGYGAKYDIVLYDMDVNAKYGVAFEHQTMGEAYAETTFPMAVNVDSISLEIKSVLDYDAMVNKLVANVTFTDPAGTDNYYQLYGGGYRIARTVERYVYNEEKGYDEALKTDTINVVSYTLPESYQQIDPLIAPREDDIIAYTENQFLIFNDELIDGKSYTMQVVLDSYSDQYLIENLDTTAGEFLSYSVGLRTITKDMYLYYKSLGAFYWNDGSPFSEPVQVFSNVDNGLGIISAFRGSNSSGSYGSVDTSKVYWSNKYY